MNTSADRALPLIQSEAVNTIPLLFGLVLEPRL